MFTCVLVAQRQGESSRISVEVRHASGVVPNHAWSLVRRLLAPFEQRDADARAMAGKFHRGAISTQFVTLLSWAAVKQSVLDTAKLPGVTPSFEWIGDQLCTLVVSAAE